MKTTVIRRHIEITSELRELISRKFEKLERLLNDSAVSAQVILSREQQTCTAEVVLHARGDHVLRDESDGSAWAEAVGIAVDQVDQQAHTLKGKWETRRRRSVVKASADKLRPNTPPLGVTRLRVTCAPNDDFVRTSTLKLDMSNEE